MPADRAGSVGWELTLAGKKVEPTDIISFVVNKALNQPDECVVVLKNTDHKYAAMAKDGESISLKTTSPGKDDKKLLFDGKIGGTQPQYAGGGESRISVRGYCSLF